MQLKVVRREYSETTTLGRLFVNGSDFCYTLEDKVRPKGQKVQAQTAIPAGSYKVIIDFSNRFQKNMIHILNVPMFEGVRIHGGNTAANTEGCILVARNRVDSSTIQGSMSDAVMKLVGEAIARGEKVTIEITNTKQV